MTNTKNIFGEKVTKNSNYEAIKNFINSKGYDEFKLKEVEDADISISSFTRLVDIEYIINKEYRPITLKEACNLLNEVTCEGNYGDIYCSEDTTMNRLMKEGVATFIGYRVKDNQICELYKYYTVKIKGWR